MHPEWTSWAMGRLDLAPADLTDRVLRLTGLPETLEGREIVDLHLCALDVSLDVGSPELLVPQLAWELNRWPQVSGGPDGSRVWGAVRFVLGEHLDELTLLAVVRHVERADALAAGQAARQRDERAGGGLTGLVGMSGDVGGYLAHAVAGRDGPAVDHVLRLAETGWSAPDVLLRVLGPAQDELGRLWERGVLSVAQEHMATAVTHLAMYALYPRLVPEERLGLTLVAATPPGDRHTVGLRMVTDLLRHRGWDAEYVGASCPVADLVEAAVEADASLLLLGGSMTCHLPGLREAVGVVRADRRADAMTVMVGGAPFRDAPVLGDWVGADLAVGDAAAALEAAERLLAPEGASRT